jgi:tetratricopeptide (TPR) repeat protein
MTGKILTALTKIEADTHWSNGQIEEALDIYKSLLSSSPNMTLNTKVSIEARINLLSAELENPPDPEDHRDIDNAIQKLQTAINSDESVLDLRKKAQNFYKKGLFADALENLKLLIRQNAADEFCVTAVAGCIMHLYALKDLEVGTDLFLSETFESANKAALFRMMLANKMATKGFPKHAKILERHHDHCKTTNLD